MGLGRKEKDLAHGPGLQLHTWGGIRCSIRRLTTERVEGRWHLNGRSLSLFKAGHGFGTILAISRESTMGARRGKVRTGLPSAQRVLLFFVCTVVQRKLLAESKALSTYYVPHSSKVRKMFLVRNASR